MQLGLIEPHEVFASLPDSEVLLIAETSAPEGGAAGREAQRLRPGAPHDRHTVLPIATRICEASAERPYLGVILALVPALVGSVMVEFGDTAPPRQAAQASIDVRPLESGLLDATVCLIPQREVWRHAPMWL
jgi:hypothetical protein